MRFAVIFVAVVAIAGPSQASSSCLSLAEARHRFGHVHLYWHGADHCWDATSGRRHHVARAHAKHHESRKAEKKQHIVQSPKWREARSELTRVVEPAPLRSEPVAQSDPTPEPADVALIKAEWSERWIDVAQAAPLYLVKAQSGPETLAPAAPDSDLTMLRHAFALLVFGTGLMVVFVAILLRSGATSIGLIRLGRRVQPAVRARLAAAGSSSNRLTARASELARWTSEFLMFAGLAVRWFSVAAINYDRYVRRAVVPALAIAARRSADRLSYEVRAERRILLAYVRSKLARLELALRADEASAAAVGENPAVTMPIRPAVPQRMIDRPMDAGVGRPVPTRPAAIASFAPTSARSPSDMRSPTTAGMRPSLRPSPGFGRRLTDR